MELGETRTCPDCGEPMQLGGIKGGIHPTFWQKLPRRVWGLRALFGRARQLDAWACEKCGAVVLALRMDGDGGSSA